MKTIFLSLLLISSSLYASCISSIDFSKAQINWTAFKTPAKVGVKGSFKNFKVNATGNNLDNAEVEIDTSSVYTKNKQRDAKIYKHFFKRMVSSTKIKAKILNFTKSTLDLEVKMNKSTIIVPMDVSIRNGILKANGIIDIFDFNMYKNLKSINYACKELHQGKTWNDVQIELVLKYPKSCL